jgi:hypothetical protein
VSVNSGNILDLTAFRSVRQSNSRVFRGSCRCSCRTDRRSCSLIPPIVGFFSLALTVLLLRRIFEPKRPNNVPLHCELWEVDLLADWDAPCSSGPETISLLSILSPHDESPQSPAHDDVGAASLIS